MRGGKSFLILLVLALGLGYYAYVVEPTKESTRDQKLKREKVFSVESDQIESLIVKAASGDSTTLKKDNGTWKIVAPKAMAADAAEVSAITTALAGLEEERVVEENPPSLKEFTLDPPRISVSFTTTGNATTHRLDVGVKTPMGADLYAKAEGKTKVFLIGSYREDALNKSTFNLRDKTVLVFDRDNANFLKIDGGKTPVVLAKRDNQWRLSVPFDAAADFSSADGLVGRLFQSQMKAYVTDDGTTDLKTYGLDKPKATVTIGAGAGKYELALGGKDEAGNVYARVGGQPAVFTLDASLLDDLTRPAADLRQKDVFEFRAFTALSLSVTRGGQTWTIARQGAPVEGKPAEWKLTAGPSANDKALDATRVNDLLTNVSSLRAETFVDAPGAGEETTVTATFGDAAAPRTETVTFRVMPAKDKAGTPTVHAVRKGDKGAMTLGALDFDKALAVFKELTGAK